jgi:transposase
VITDLTPTVNKTGLPREPAEDMAGQGRVVAMGGFAGVLTAAAEKLPAGAAVMDPFHVMCFAGDALDNCRQRVQQAARGHRGSSDDPLCADQRALHNLQSLLTRKQ